MTQETKNSRADWVSQISETRILHHIVLLQGERHPDSSPKALKKTGEALATQMQSAGLETRNVPIPGMDATGSSCFNVVGTVPGEDFQKPCLVIGAHYDTVLDTPGADDNASSLAVLLEVARITTPLFQKSSSHIRPQFVAFSLEESGFVGSHDYVKKTKENGTTIYGALILECVGYTNHQVGSQLTPPGLPIALPDRGDFIGLLGNTSAKPITQAFESAVKHAAPDLPHISLVLPKAGEVLPDVRRSDHVPFWDEDIPAVMVTDTANFRNPHYHLPSDRIETLDIAFITKIARTLAATIVDLAGLET